MFLKTVLVLLVAINISLAFPLQSNVALTISSRSALVDCLNKHRDIIKELLQSTRDVLEQCGGKSLEKVLELYDNTIESFENVQPEVLKVIDEIYECGDDTCRDDLVEKLVQLLGPSLDKMISNIQEMHNLYKQEDEGVRVCADGSIGVLSDGLANYLNTMNKCLEENSF